MKAGVGSDDSAISCDVLVVGGGIYGLGVAWDAALRGLSVIVLERKDFGAATSAACFKIVHGGLRYLQHLDFKRLKSSVEEQRHLRIIAPHLIRPLPIVVPCYGHGRKGRGFLQLGLKLYELLSGDRNREVQAELALPAHGVLSRQEVLELAPGLVAKDVTGGVQFYDAQMISCERLTLAVGRSAEAAGAKLFHYTEFQGAELRDGSIHSVTAKNLLQNKVFTIHPKLVVNAAGPWTANILERIFGSGAVRPKAKFFSRGFQLVLPEMIAEKGLAIESNEYDRDSRVGRGARSFFMVPWQGRSLLGTTDDAFSGEADEYSVRQAEVVEFLKAVRQSYQSHVLEPNKVQSVFGGLVPAEVLAGGMGHRVVKDHQIEDHQRPFEVNSACNNLVSVVGVKYTTFRLVAEETVDLLLKKLSRPVAERPTRQRPLIGGNIPSIEKLIAEIQKNERAKDLSENSIRTICHFYGSETEDVLALISDKSSPAALSPLEAAQIRFAVKKESAVRIADVLARRLNITPFGRPSAVFVEATAAVLAEELGWDSNRMKQEIEVFNADVAALYPS